MATTSPLTWRGSTQIRTLRTGFPTSRFPDQLFEELSKGQEFNLHLLKRGAQVLDQMFNSIRIKFEGIDVAYDVPEAQELVYGMGGFY